MKQSINLYLGTLQRKQVALNATTIGTITLALMVLLWLIHAILDWQHDQQLEDIAILTEQRNIAQQALSTAEQNFIPKIKSQALSNELIRLQNEKKALERLIEKLKRGEIGNSKGFSSYLTGLATPYDKELWITGIALFEGGKSLILQGETSRPKLVPKLLKALGKQPAFAKRSFYEFKMERLIDTKKILKFDIRTQPSQPANKEQ